MNVMFDINVVLDIVARRQPFYGSSRTAFLKVIEDGDRPCLSAHAFATLYYLLGTASTRKQREVAMQWIFESFAVAGLGEVEVSAARGYGLSDFEDALVVATAVASKCRCILTRNVRDFKGSVVKAMDPAEFVSR